MCFCPFLCLALFPYAVVSFGFGQVYKKNYPPKLEDEVWRLEKIGKEGAFHKKLANEGIYTVQDFLKLSVVDTQKLKKILGVGMSERMWEVTLKHAKTCEMGNKIYIFRGNQLSLMLNPICQVLKAEINGQVYSSRDMCYNNRPYIESLAREAYANWNSLEVLDGIVNETALLTQGEAVTMDQQYNHGHALEQNEHPIEDKSMMSMGYNMFPSNAQIDCTDWMQANKTLPYNNIIYGPIDSSIRATISESSSDGDLPSRGL